MALPREMISFTLPMSLDLEEDQTSRVARTTASVRL